jgi:hypothetical protein
MKRIKFIKKEIIDGKSLLTVEFTTTKRKNIFFKKVEIKKEKQYLAESKLCLGYWNWVEYPNLLTLDGSDISSMQLDIWNRNKEVSN